MTCEELRDAYDAFALGMEEQPETNEILEHLHRDCPNCVPGIRNSLQLITRMGGLSESVAPPSRLQRRIVASVKPELLEQRTPQRAVGWSAVWAALAIVSVTVAVLLGVQARHLSELRFADSSRLRTAINVLTAPDSQEVTFGNARNVPPRGRVLVNRRKRGVALFAANLPPVAQGKAFQLWLIPRGANPISAGVFPSSADGTAVVSRAMEIPENLGAVAVTVEDEIGVAAPTTTPIIAAETK